MPTDVHLRRVRFFIEVVRRGGFSPAARVLSAAQSTVSKGVRHLEEQLGVQLIERTGSGRELTEAGRIVYARGLELLSAGAALADDLDDLRGLRKGTLRIGFPPLGTSALFGAELAAFRREHPGIAMQMEAQAPARLADMLRAGTLDVIATFDGVPGDMEGRSAHRSELVALVPRSHPLAQHDALGWNDIGAAAQVLFDEKWAASARIVDAIRQAGLREQVVARTSDVELIFELVASAAGVGYVPAPLAATRVHPEVRVVPLQRPIPWTIDFAWRRGGVLPFAARAWLLAAAPIGDRIQTVP